MKKVAILAMAVFSLSIASATISNSGEKIEKVVPAQGQVKIVNDTKTDLRIHTGQGHVPLSRGGGSTSVSCEKGRKISHSNGSKATDLIFVIDESMCGKTVKLSQYIK